MPEIKITKSHRRTISMEVSPEGILHVKAPWFASNTHIQQFITQHQDWVDKHVTLAQKKPQREKHAYQNGETFWYLGDKVILTTGDYTTIEVKDGKLLFPRGLVFRIQKELTDWYVRTARVVITQQVSSYAAQMQTNYKDLTFSDTKSQWGRCTQDNRLQFSWRLVMAPLLTLNYVVIHELAHTVEKNHSRAFWSIVRRYTPSYRQQIKWLQTNGHALVV